MAGVEQAPGVVPDTKLYPEFDENLRDAMAQETRLFVASQMREDRSVSDLLTANYTFVNERLAKHYGIPDVYGNHFRRVTFTDGMRGGLLGQASILTVTSYPNRTSVAIRGRWLLANMLGSPPPPPPPDVPALKDAGADGQPRSLRERMEVHRKNPVCASCHQRMDPLGFSLENFDAVGKWRTEAMARRSMRRRPCRTARTSRDCAGLRTLLAGHKEDFVRTFTGKLLAYAIGRGIEYYGFARDPQDRARRGARTIIAGRRSYWGSSDSAPFSMGIVAGGAPGVRPMKATQTKMRRLGK